MRNARTLLQEQQRWKVTWQQVETFLDQIDGAADSDGVHRRRMEGLLRAARAVEHERARAAPDTALGDPVITALPPAAYVVKDGSTATLSAADAWDDAKRRWRLPGADETELAVGLLAVDPGNGEIYGDHNVNLPPPVTVFQMLGEDGVRRPLRLPSYPGPASATIAEGFFAGPAGPSVKDVGERISLFGHDARLAATMGTGGDASPLRLWSTLCRARRLADRTQSSGDDQVKLSSFVTGPPWGTGTAQPLQQVALIGAGIALLPAGAAVPAATLTQLRTAVAAALAAVRPDAEDLFAAAAMVDADGVSDPALAELIATAGAASATRLTSLAAIDTTAAGLQSAPTSGALRTELDSAVAALGQAVLPAALFAGPVEGRVLPQESPLAMELDRQVEARVSYPDGTLRGLRTLEGGFVATWPAFRRWFVLRYAGVLAPAMTAFRSPFVAGLGAILRGGFTGLTADGLTIGAAGAAIGTDQIDLDLPGSTVATLAGALEPGQVGMIGGERPAAVVLVGVSARLGRASLHVSPLRLSTASPSVAPGPVGTVPPGTAIGRLAARGLTPRELRRGRSDDGPGHDAPVREALSLYSRLGLLFGTDAVERWLQGLPATAALATRLVPEPAAPPTLHGTVPGYATTIVLHGLPPAFWSAPGQDGAPAGTATAEPRVARAGELLLLRGRAAGDGDAPGPLVQAPIDVDDVFAVAGDALSRMDTTRAAVLSTSPAALPAQPPASGAALVCGPDEPLAVILLRRSWARDELLSEVSLRRRFTGFDSASLAARTLLPLDLATVILRGQAPPDVPGVVRTGEFAAALDVLDDWTRYGA